MIDQIKAKKRLYRYPNSISDDLKKANLDHDHELVFTLARELVNAQFWLGDHELTNRLWLEVAERDIDERRIIHLMYRCICHDDDDAMLDADWAYMNN